MDLTFLMASRRFCWTTLVRLDPLRCALPKVQSVVFDDVDYANEDELESALRPSLLHLKLSSASDWLAPEDVSPCTVAYLECGVACDLSLMPAIDATIITLNLLSLGPPQLAADVPSQLVLRSTERVLDLIVDVNYTTGFSMVSPLRHKKSTC
jgi:hypothetical protein